MKIIKNEDFESKVEKKVIDYVQFDYTLTINDLKNLKVEYDETTRQVYATFSPIYVQGINLLYKVDMIFGNFKSYQVNGNVKKLAIGQDIVEFLYKFEEEYFRKRGG